ncbi:MAG: thiol:disulfide interchange protein DsbA/DsbL [Lysobacterales bacterium]|jgi:thiol:disulfide interchange protein DsbA
MLRKILLAVVFVLGGQLAAAQADTAATFQEGRHYYKIKQATAPRSDGKVEVIVLFSYLCSHCNVLEPYVDNWAAKQPDNIFVNRMHVSFGGIHELFARGYIVSEMTGVVEQSHPAMMDAIWKDRKRFRNPEQLAGFYTQFGVGKDRFLANFNSFATDSQLRRIEQNTRAWGVTGTPSIIVNRKYRVPNTAMVWDVVDYLVARELVPTGS